MHVNYWYIWGRLMCLWANCLKCIKDQKNIFVVLRMTKYLNAYFLEVSETRRILLVFEEAVDRREGHLFNLCHLECSLCFCLIWSVSPSLRNNKIAILIFTSKILSSAKVDWYSVSSKNETRDRTALVFATKLFGSKH